MKTKYRKKPTNKEIRMMLEGIQYELMTTQSQLNTLTKIFSDFLDYTHKKTKFLEYLKEREEYAKSGSVENPEVKQKSLESV